jgi:hypothetical protein
MSPPPQLSVSATTLAAGNSTVQVPGPSQALFNNPYYSCVHNYYVAANGNDANNGSSNAPWLTLQHADSMNLGAGSCVNVAPGTYDGLTVTHGGNLASSTGYVVYRCTTMDACTINGDAGPNWNGSVTFDYTKVKAGVPNTVNYVQFDGFVLAGAPLANQGPWGVGFNVYNGTNNQEIASHHVWLLNSIVHGFSQGGISLTAAEYHYAIHNMSYDNGNTTCDAQGSGISVFIEHPLPNYAQTADDFTNPNPLIGTFQRGDGQFFHNVIAWNITYNNALTQCGTVANAYDTDGNGIIFDTNALAAGNSVDYPYPMLAAFNLSYNNGGGGVHLFSSAHITVANNSCYNNYLDPAISGSARGCIDDNQGFDNTFINNIAVAIPTAHTTCAYSVAPYAMWNSAVLGVPLQAPFDTFNHNVTNIEGGSSSCNGEIVAVNGDTYSTSANKESTNPLWVNVGATSTGSETMPPIGADFRLQAGSPALGYALSEPYLPSYTTDAGAYQSGAVTGDATPPSVPTGLTATAASTTQINLSWTASTDNVGVKNYQVFRNGTQVGAPTTTSYSDTGLTASTSYSYTVKATDAAGNVSIASSIASATTQALQVPPVNGACGTSNGSTVATKPTTNLCSTGTSSTVAGTGPWSWSCAGTNGGTTAMCSAQLAPPPVNGTCGLSNGTTLASLPTANLCSTGTASTVSGTGPWSWSCAGSNNGTTAACSAQLASSSPTSAQKPGPSVDLFNHPYYSCQHNFYVNGATGNDSYDGTSPTFVGGTTGPWATIANADTSLRTGGDCINVAPGTYGQFNEDLKYGGFKAQSTGYVVYRCTVPSFISGTGCVITDSYKAAHAGQWTTSSKYPNYLIFDGFNFESSDPTLPDAVAIGCSGPGTFGTTQTTSVGCHHWWIINNIINGYGIAGVGNGDTEYWYTAHNTVTQNAHQVCMGYYGSGIGYVVAKPVAGYQKTPDDLNANNNPSLNLMGIQGPNFGFNNVIAWNVVGNNYQGCSGFGLGNTDGNGIIIDTFNITPCNANQVDYPNSTLVAFNVVYNSGGGGVHVFASANVTVANNSTFNNFLDPTISAWERANIDISCGVGTNGFGANTDLLINNIAYALPNGQACPGPNNSYMGSMVPFGIGGDNTQIDGLFNSPGRNISYSVGITCNPTGASENTTFGVNPDWNCTTNKCMTNPLWVNVGNTSIGTLQTPPNGINFALQPGSPAIGYGVTEPYLPASSVDAGACSSQFTTCP